MFIDPVNRAAFDYTGLANHCRKSLPKYAVPRFLRIIEQQNLGHNNKQNKVPLRNEGVDLQKVLGGTAGPQDTILWLPDRAAPKYIPFTANDWNQVAAGKTKL